MGAERGCFRSHRSAQAPGEILRVGQECGRLLELNREMALEIENMPPEIEAPRQVGRSRLVVRGTRGVVGGVDSGESIELIVERRKRRAVGPHQDARAAMRRGRDRLDWMTQAEFPQRAGEERPSPFRIELEIGRLGVRSERGVRPASLGQNLAGAVEDDNLDVGLAEVENRDAARHALNLGGSRAARATLLARGQAAARRRIARPPQRGRAVNRVASRSRICRCWPCRK